MKIEVRPKALAKIYNPGEAWACISIATYSGTWPEFCDTPSQLLQMSFADLDSKVNGFEIFESKHASEILDFYLNLTDVSYLLVHCELGVSRSPAVAAALSKIFFKNDDFFFKNYSPNIHVYRLILNQAFQRGLI